MLKLRKEEVDRLVGVVCDDHPSGTHCGLANIVFCIRQPFEDRCDDLGQMGLEACSKCSGQENQQRHKSFPDGASRRLSIRNNIWK